MGLIKIFLYTCIICFDHILPLPPALSFTKTVSFVLCHSYQWFVCAYIMSMIYKWQNHNSPNMSMRCLSLSRNSKEIHIYKLEVLLLGLHHWAVLFKTITYGTGDLAMCKALVSKNEELTGSPIPKARSAGVCNHSTMHR